MRPSEVARRGADYLARHGVETSEANAERLMAWVLGTDRAGVAVAETLSPEQARAYGRALCSRCTGTPLQHLTGEEGFRRLVLSVRPGVFVPRPETEILVETALACIVAVDEPEVVDACTGAGAVALAIADERPDARVSAMDLSPEAVALAADNASRLGLAVAVAEGDLLEGVVGPIDLVTCNPPYVPDDRREALPVEVLADPELAVFGGPPIYARLFGQAFGLLRPGGWVVVEIEESTAAVVAGLAIEAGFEEVSVRQDLNGRDRVVAARRP